MSEDLITTGKVCERLGFNLPVEFVLNTLKIQPAGIDKRAKLFSEAQFLEIGAALRNHVAAVMDGNYCGPRDVKPRGKQKPEPVAPPAGKTPPARHPLDEDDDDPL